MSEEYKRTCHDEIEWVEVEQLHTATLEISKNCFEYKKFCVTLLGVGAALLIKFPENSLNHFSFLIALIMCIGFWLADATAYYYQRSVRKAMDSKLNSIALRNNVNNYLRSSTEIPKWKALINESMTLYYVLLLAIILSGWRSI